MAWLALMPRWAWMLAAGAVAVLVLAGIYTARIHAAEKRGYDRAVAEGQSRIAEMQAAVDAASSAEAAAQAKVADVGVRYVERIRTVVRDGPCLDSDGVRETRAAREAVASPAGIGADPVSPPPDR